MLFYISNENLTFLPRSTWCYCTAHGTIQIYMGCNICSKYH